MSSALSCGSRYASGHSKVLSFSVVAVARCPLSGVSSKGRVEVLVQIFFDRVIQYRLD